MRHARILLVLICATALLPAQQKADEGPTNEKARKTFRDAFEYVQRRMPGAALDEFKKADKQDEGHCVACQKNMIKLGMEMGKWKVAEQGALELEGEALGPKEVSMARYRLGAVIYQEALNKHKEDLFEAAHQEFVKALQAAPKFPNALLDDGRALAHMNKDEEAKARFEQVVKMLPEDAPDRQRAMRFISEPELARARMAPPFAVITEEGQRFSMDELAGKVVLIDFWATWCGPCRAALPHMREIAKKFHGQPLVVLSISLDEDEEKWKAFIAKNEMTWPQYRDGGFTGPIAKAFGVSAIPHTFTIDTDGVLQDEHIGDASIQGKLKKLVARAQEIQAKTKPAQGQN